MIEIKMDITKWDELERRIAAAGSKAPKAMQRALNRVGDMARTRMVRALADQTGLKQKTTRKALKKSKASAGVGAGAAYVIESGGGNIRLKFFRARETRRGVSAAPWNRRRTYAGVFMKGGRFPRRVDLGLGGATLKRTGKSRYPLKGVRSGLFIPKEMVTGQTAGAFYSTANNELAARLLHELGFILGGGR